MRRAPSSRVLLLALAGVAAANGAGFSRDQCVFLDFGDSLQSVKKTSTGGSFSFRARVPNWQQAARISVKLVLHLASSVEPATGAQTCPSWCHPDAAGGDEYCSWCTCAACESCESSSALRSEASCQVPGRLTSCWGARVVQREDLGDSTLRLGPLTTDRDFGCTVAMPANAEFSPPDLACLDPMPGPPPSPPSPPSSPSDAGALPAGAGGTSAPAATAGSDAAPCIDYVPTADGYPFDAWHDSRGPNFDCWFYANGGAQQPGGCVVAGSHFGRTAEQACCACGGGSAKAATCDMDAAVRMKPRGGDAALLEVGVSFWRPGAIVRVHLGDSVSEEKLRLTASNVWDAKWLPDLSDTTPKPWQKRDAVLAFRLGPAPRPSFSGLSAAPSFSFLLGGTPDMREVAHIRPSEWIVGGNVTVAWRSAGHAGVRTVWGAQLVKSHSSNGGGGAGATRSHMLTFRMGRTARSFFAFEMSGKPWATPPHVACSLPTRACEGTSLSYAARGKDSAVVAVSPWAGGADVTLRYSNHVGRPPRVSGVTGGRVVVATASELTLHLDASAPMDGEKLTIATAGDADLPPASIGCVASDAPAPLPAPTEARVAGGTSSADPCAEIKRSMSNARELKPKAMWCHELGASSTTASAAAVAAVCRSHYYQIEPSWLVPCVLADGKCAAASAEVTCGTQRPASTPPPPAPSSDRSSGAAQGPPNECAHLLRPAQVEALSSASYLVRPRLGDPAAGSPPPACERGVQFGVEVSQGGGGWRAIEALPMPSKGPDGLLVDGLRCGDVRPAGSAGSRDATGGGAPLGRCMFRVRGAGWGEASRPSVAVAGKPLSALPRGAARVELTMRTGRSGAVCLACEDGRAMLIADVAAAMQLPSASHVRAVEVREVGERSAVILDLVPTPTRNASVLAEQLASLLPLAASELHGGDVTQYVDGSRGLRRQAPSGQMEAVSARRAVLRLSVGPPAGAAAAAPPASAGVSIVRVLLYALVALALVRIAHSRRLQLERVWLDAKAQARLRFDPTITRLMSTVADARSLVGGDHGGGRHAKLATDDGLQPVWALDDADDVPPPEVQPRSACYSAGDDAAGVGGMVHSLDLDEDLVPGVPTVARDGSLLKLEQPVPLLPAPPAATAAILAPIAGHGAVLASPEEEAAGSGGGASILRI